MTKMLILAASLTAPVVYASGPSKIHVNVSFIEALAPKDTTSSERFQKEYETAVALGKKHSAEQLVKCGYEISEKFSFYDASDNIQALEQAKKSVSDGAWLLVGPRRSNHYLLFAQGASLTPTISLMASASEVSGLGPLHLSMAPLNKQMAQSAVRKVKELSKADASNYVSVVSEDCVSCVDFAAEFDKAASLSKIKKLDEIKILGDAPNLEPVKSIIKKLKPNIVILPNYSKVSAGVIHALLPIIPNAIFVGGDGWGDSKFGFVQNNENLDAAKGFTVRGFPPLSNGLSQFDLGKRLLKDDSAKTLESGSALALLRIFDVLEKFLCEAKPKTANDFQNAFRAKGDRFFSAPWGVSIYSLNSGKITFQEKGI